MPTKRPRVAAYLSESLYERFKQFASDRKLGDSQALIRVLSDYFGVDYQVAHGELPQVLERVEQLESSLSTMRSDLLDELKRVVLAELAPQAVLVAIPPSETEKTPIEDWARRLAQDQDVSSSEVLISPAENVPVVESKVIDVLPVTDGELRGEPLKADIFPLLELSSDLSSEVESSVCKVVDETLPHGLADLGEEIVYLTIDLAKRLRCSRSTILRRKEDSPEKFAEWSSRKDPDGLPWKTNTEDGLSPVGDIPLEIKQCLAQQSVKRLSEGLNNQDLGKRLKVHGSTISHWKKEKSADDFLKATRERDPEGVGWIYVEEAGCYITDSGNSPRMTQSELPGIVSPEGVDF